MKVREAIYTRRTIRKFRLEPISDDVLRELVEAARFAPSASNMQPLKYKLVGSADAARVFPHVHWAGAIRPAGDPKPGEEPTGRLVETDGTVVTGKGPGATFYFAAAVARALGVAPQTTGEVLASMFATAE